MVFQDYIKGELLILVPVLYFLGIGLKKSRISNKFIPAILGGAGIVLAILLVFSTVEVSNIQAVATALFTAVTQGILTAGTSVYLNQLYIQSKKEE